MLIEKRKLVLLSLWALPLVHSIELNTLWAATSADALQTAVKGVFSLWLIILGLSCATSSMWRTFFTAKAFLLYSIFSILSLLWTVSYERTGMAILGFVSILFLAIAAQRISRESLARVLLKSSDLIVLVSLLAYILNFGDVVVVLQGVERLSGITFGPHALARLVALSLVLRAYLYYLESGLSKLGSVIMLFAYVFVLLKTDSRQAYLVIVPSVFLIWLLSGDAASKIRVVMALIISIAAALPVFGLPTSANDKLAGFSRSEADDVATLTGRTFIWSKSLELIKDKPYVGYGMHGGGLMLSQNYFTHTSGWTTESAHNLFIQTALDLGGVGLILIVFVFIFSGVRGFRRRDGLSMSLMAFVLILGLVERSIAGAPGFLNFLFFYAVLSVYQASFNCVSSGSED